VLSISADAYLQGISSPQQIPRGPEHGIPDKGLSGYDPTFQDMRGIFYGIGPGIYILCCHLTYEEESVVLSIAFIWYTLLYIP
jgi:hypothetical protein